MEMYSFWEKMTNSDTDSIFGEISFFDKKINPQLASLLILIAQL